MSRPSRSPSRRRLDLPARGLRVRRHLANFTTAFASTFASAFVSSNGDPGFTAVAAPGMSNCTPSSDGFRSSEVVNDTACISDASTTCLKDTLSPFTSR